MILPFIKYLVSEVNININIYMVYLLFLISTIVSYLMVYKRNMLYADQKNYYINIIHCGYLVILNITQLIILALTKNYYLYLVIKIICQIIENIIITHLANRLYPFINETEDLKLDKESKDNIFKKVKALIFHKIGFIVINSTDNIIISMAIIVNTFFRQSFTRIERSFIDFSYTIGNRKACCRFPYCILNEFFSILTIQIAVYRFKI